MKSSRTKRRLPQFGFQVESLETRALLSATVTTTPGAQALSTGQTLSNINLGSFFTDPLVTGTAVVLQTPSGNIPLVLTDSQTPNTVTNFNHYITSGKYASTVIHRSVPGFVIQGGGYTTAGAHIPVFGTIAGEHHLSNTTGTIAMALSNGPDTGTSEWFINLADNSSTLDGAQPDGGPFTAFGKVVYNGMSVVNTIQNLPIVNDTGFANGSNGAGGELPVLSGTNHATVSSEPANNLVTLNPLILPGGLTYAVSSSNTNLVTASVDSAGKLTLTSVGGAGSANITVTATDMGGGTAQATFAANVTVAASVVTATGVTGINATAATAVTTTTATFTDTKSSTTTADYSAVINWGDGTTSAGTIATNGGSGNFKVVGTHTYATANTYSTTTTITPGAGAAASGSGSVIVQAATSNSVVNATGVTAIAATTNIGLSTAVATFTDTKLTTTTADYTAVINWGDGTTSAGTIATNGAAGSFKVNGTHTYTSANTFTTTISITPSTGSAATATGSVHVQNGTSNSVVTLTGVTGISAIKSTALSAVTVATFTDSKSGTTTGDYTAAINWGDGTTSAGTVSTNGAAGSFKVTGTHTYATTGTFTTTIAVTPSTGSAASASGSVAVTTLSNTSVVTASGVTGIISVRGLAFTATVAKFSDSKSATTAGDYTAVISWGDGSTSAGTISATSVAGNFNVSGSHTYATATTYVTRITITPSTGSAALTKGSIIARKPHGPSVLSATGILELRLTRGVPSTVTAATFTDKVSGLAAGTYAATINWGDGTTSAGSISNNGAAGSFGVTGTHSYTSAGSYTTSTTITPAIGGAATTTGSASVRRPITFSTIALDATSGSRARRGAVSRFLLANFTDTVHSNLASSYDAAIDWGDGTSGAASVVGNAGVFQLFANHIYATAGVYVTTIEVTPPNQATVSATSSITVKKPVV